VKLNKERNNKKAYYSIQDVQESSEQLGGSVDLKEPLLADKEYVNVIKKVKKENITCDNIAEIMLCQIPGVSSVSALAIMKKFTTLSNLIKELENNPTCLHDITTVTKTGQNRKISSTIIANIKKYLVPQPQTQQMPTLIS
jgi:ERCC4-type nuclease